MVVQGYCTPVVINGGREKCRGLQEPTEGARMEEETAFPRLDGSRGGTWIRSKERGTLLTARRKEDRFRGPEDLEATQGSAMP